MGIFTRVFRRGEKVVSAVDRVDLAPYRIIRNGMERYRIQALDFDVDAGSYYRTLRVNNDDLTNSPPVEFGTLEEAQEYLRNHIAATTWREVEP